MAGDCGLNALSLLPENVLPQWQQKIAQMRKKCHPAPNGLTIWTCFIFRTKCDFLQVLDLHIFRQVARLLMPVPLPFSPLCFNVFCYLAFVCN